MDTCVCMAESLCCSPETLTLLLISYTSIQVSQVALVVKNLPANAGDKRDLGSIPGLGRCYGEGHDNPLQYSCLENPMHRGDWRASVHRVIKSQMRLKWLRTAYTHTPIKNKKLLKKKKTVASFPFFLLPTETISFTFWKKRQLLYWKFRELKKGIPHTHHVFAFGPIHYQGFQPLILPLEISVNPVQSSWRGNNKTI